VAKAYNNLDYTEIEEMASDQIIYENQSIFNPLKGKREVTGYLKRLFDKMKNSGNLLFAEIGIVKEKSNTRFKYFESIEGSPCLIMSLGHKENKVALILIEAEGDKLARIDICTVAPHWSQAEVINEYAA
jgi:hypothetical protein